MLSFHISLKKYNRRIFPASSCLLLQKWIQETDWPTDPALPEKLNISQLDAAHGAEWTDGPTMHIASAPCKVNEILRRTEVE